MGALAETLGALAQACRQLSLRWYLFGAQAAIAHGSARLTADIDATVELGATRAEALIEAMRSAGFTLRVSDAEGFVERTRVLPFVHDATSMNLDLVRDTLKALQAALAQSDLVPAFEQALARARGPAR